MVAVSPNGNQLPFLFLETDKTASRKDEVSEMIESKNGASRNLEKALQALEQAKQRVANEKKKQNEKKRKAENHHKYIMGGIIVKYFPEYNSISREKSKTATELAYAEVISYNKKNLERELQNESRQQGRQENMAKRRDEEI